MGEMSYPIPEMHQTASTQRKKIDEVWNQHLTFHNTIRNQAAGLMGSAASVFTSHLDTWHNELQKHYNELTQLADTLDGSAQTADTQDLDISNSFKGFKGFS
jgi:WXG100 family type VII secretion target